MKLRSYDVQPFISQDHDVPTSQRRRDSINEIRYNKEGQKKEKGDDERETRQRQLCKRDSRDHVIAVFCIFFLKLLLIKNPIIVMTKIMF